MVPKQTDPAFIPFRFHMYWAGADPDGKVAGFYFAVVETLPLPVPPDINTPPLPGPKPQDYKFTTKTDSVFIFSVSAERSDRQHTFYIYAVDNLGRPDPTPARFIFWSKDRYPPLPVMDSFLATGLVWEQDPVTLALTRRLQTVAIPDSEVWFVGAKPKTTVPNASRLDIAWHAVQTTVDNPAVGYRYKLDEPEFISVDSSVTRVSYNTAPEDAVGPGVKVFRVQALDRANGAKEISRIFQMNNAPITWFSGPDREASVWTRNGNDRYVDVGSNWANIPNLSSAGLLSSDSIKVMPSQRPKRRTFYEFYNNKIFARQEGDTVDMNSWVVFHNGGFDSDSPYSVLYSSNVPSAPDSNGNPVLQIRPSNGSPIGFRSRIPMSLWPTGQNTGPSQTSIYPNYDPASVNRVPAIAGYWALNQSGVAYLFARAEDGNGELDRRLSSRSDLDPATIVKAVDSTGSANADQIALRPLIIKFYVDKAPELQFGQSGFSPAPGATITQRNIPVSMPAYDPDPFDQANSPGPGGNPGGNGVILSRYWLRFRGLRAGGAGPGDSVTFAPSQFFRVPGGLMPTSLTLPDSLANGQVRVMVELCDCSQCENISGSGRCSFYSYYVTLSVAPQPMSSTTPDEPGPGSQALVDKKRGEQ